MANGRPPKITIEWADEKAKTLTDMFKNGESLAEVCCELDICKESFYKAEGLSVNFSYAYKRGKQYSEAWWTKLGRAGAAGKVGIQPATWCFNMKNRFNWKDKQETVHSGNLGLTDMSEDKLNERIRQLESLSEQSSKD